MYIMETIQSIFTFDHVLMMFIGMAGGIIIGALPGLNVIFAIAVLLPFTFDMDSLSGMYLLLGAYCGATYGGSISAILINTPGTPNAAATLFDGYPLSQQGRAGDALKAALFGSFVGGVISCLALLFFAPLLARVALKIASPEYFALCIFGLTAVIGVSGNQVLKGLIMAIFGLFMSTVGIDATEGVQRFMFGNMQLLAGLKPATVSLGVFALTEVLVKSQQVISARYEKSESIVFEKAQMKTSYLFRYWRTMLKSSIIGVIIGAIPGTGGAIAAMFSYNEARRSSKNQDKFGKGSIEGIVAPETANNGVTGATLIPLLTLGIPGDAAVAVLLGALTMQGITPGTALFAEGSTWVYAIMGGLLVINFIMYLQGSLFIRGFANITRVPVIALLPCIMIMCTIGAFAINNAAFDVIVMVVCGLFGFVMKKFDFPIPPLCIALVLGNLTEVNLRRSLMLSENGLLIFLTRPISAGIIAVAFLMLAYPYIKKAIIRRQGGKKSAFMSALDAEADAEEN